MNDADIIRDGLNPARYEVFCLDDPDTLRVVEAITMERAIEAYIYYHFANDPEGVERVAVRGPGRGYWTIFRPLTIWAPGRTRSGDLHERLSRPVVEDDDHDLVSD